MTIPQTAVETRHCRRCELDLPAADFPRGNQKTQARICKDCMTAICSGQIFTMNATEAATVMARLQAGEALRTIVGGFGGPPLCSPKAFFKHCELHPQWGEKALALAKANRKSRILEGVAKRRTNRTACNNGHALSAENVARMQSTRTWDHRWCDQCVQTWRGVGRFIAEDATEEPPPIDGFIKLSGPPRLTPADVTLIEEWLRKGVSVKKLLRPCDMVRLRKFRKENPAWEARWQPVIYANGLRAVSAASREWWKEANITHCKKGHPLTGENVYFKACSGTRQCRTCQLTHTGARVTDAMIDNIERGLLTGMNFKQITSPTDGRRSLVSAIQLRTLRIERPDVNERFARATRNPVTLKRMLGNYTVAPIRGLPTESLNQLPSNPTQSRDIPLYIPEPGDYEWLYSLTPRYLSPDDRNDIVGDLFLELSARTLRREDVPSRAKELTKKHNKENPSRAYGDIRSPLSLDAPAYLDGTMLRGETVSESLWDRI